MTALLQYGVDSSVSIEFAEGAWVAEGGRPSAEPLNDPRAVLLRALAEPVDFPPLAQSIVPGDRVALVLGEGVPRAAEILAGLIDVFMAAGVEADGISLLRRPDDVRLGVGDPSPLLSPDQRSRLQLVSHDPDDRRELAFLAKLDVDKPILLNRAVTDADVVMPIGCFHNPNAAGYHGIHGAVYPTFSDTKTLRRYRSPGALNSAGYCKPNVAKSIEKLGWLLGAIWTVQVVPGNGEQILRILAGEVEQVARQGRDAYRDAWGGSLSQRASLVIASIEGPPSLHTWQNVGRALIAAGELVEDDGAIALCTDLDVPIGPALRRLADSSMTRTDALHQIRKERATDVQVAVQLDLIQNRAKVYLLSQLDSSGLDDLEDLEIAPITDPEDLSRLAQRHESCILLSNAPRSLLTSGLSEKGDTRSAFN